eukprot:g25751.t1
MRYTRKKETIQNKVGDTEPMQKTRKSGTGEENKNREESESREETARKRNSIVHNAATRKRNTEIADWLLVLVVEDWYTVAEGVALSGCSLDLGGLQKNTLAKSAGARQGGLIQGSTHAGTWCNTRKSRGTCWLVAWLLATQGSQNPCKRPDLEHCGAIDRGSVSWLSGCSLDLGGLQKNTLAKSAGARQEGGLSQGTTHAGMVRQKERPCSNTRKSRVDMVGCLVAGDAGRVILLQDTT